MSSQSETGSSLWCGYLESHLHSNEVTALGSSILPEERKRSLREHGEAFVLQNVLGTSAIAHLLMHTCTHTHLRHESKIFLDFGHLLQLLQLVKTALDKQVAQIGPVLEMKKAFC